MIRPLFVDHTAQLGGAELYLLSIAKAFRPTGRIVLFEDGAFRRHLEEESIPTSILPTLTRLDRVRKDGSLMAMFQAVPDVLEQTWRLSACAASCDVIVANSQKAMLIGALAGLWTRRPVVWCCHDLMSSAHFGPLQRVLAGGAARYLVSHIIANSRSTRDALVDLGISTKRISVVYNGIDDAPFRTVTSDQIQAVRQELTLPDSKVIGVFSRLAAWKGQHVLLEALGDLPDVTALIVGDALFPEDRRYEEQLHRTIQAYGIEDRVRMTGFREDVPVLMHACDAIVHTSTAPEPFGRVIVEGMLARRPVVCTDAGGPAEIVADERTGRLVPPNDPATLRMAIQDVLTDPVGAAEMTERAYATARSRFSLQQLTNNVRSVLEQTVNKSIQTADRSSSPMYASS